MRRRNPIAVDVLGAINPALLAEDIDALTKRIRADDEARASWVEDCTAVRQLIDGKDKRKAKPWVGASETSVPMLKRCLRRWKPSLFNLIWQAEPVCTFSAGSVEAMDKATIYEQFFNWLVKYHMDNVANELQLMLENMGGDRGMGYLVVSWDYRSELVSRVICAEKLFTPDQLTDLAFVANVIIQEYGLDVQDPEDIKAAAIAAQEISKGARFVRLSYRRELANKPKISAFDPFDVIVPTRSGDSHTADYVCLRHRLTAEQLKQMAIDGILDPASVGRILETVPKDGAMSARPIGTDGASTETYQTTTEQDRGVNNVSKSYEREVLQIFCSLDINGDGVKERCVLWYDSATKTALTTLPYVYPFAHWPVFRFDFEISDRRPYLSRGIGQIFKDLQSHLNKQYRARSDAIDISLAPVFYQRVAVGMKARQIRWSPGRVVEVQEPGDFGEIKRNTWNLNQYMQSESEIQGFVDQTLGNITSDLAASGRRLERRSGAEAQAVAAATAAMAMMEAVNFQEVMRHVWQAVWDLWIEVGPTEQFFFVQGMPEPAVIRRSEIGFTFQLVPAGTPGNIDRQSQLDKGMSILELGLRDPTGTFNLPAVYKYVVSRFDPNLAQVALLSPAQQAQNQLLANAAKSIAENGLATPLAEGTGGGPA